MNKKIEIEKKIDFSKSVSEVTAISLEHDLKFLDSENIKGNLIVSGKYKTTLDFVYDVIDDKSLLCKIELVVEGTIIDNDRDCDGDPVDKKEIEIPKIDDKKEEMELLDADIVEEEVNEEDRDDSEVKLFNIDDNSETFGTFIVYMVRQNETINTIISKYNTSLEEIEKYNDLKELSVGSKLIIPLLKNDNK